MRRHAHVAAAVCAGLVGSAACGGAPVEREGFLPGAAGAELYYRVEGSGHDTVVVVHGGPGAGSNAVAPDLVPLAEQHTVIYYDQRGGGRSTLPSDTTLLAAEYFVEDLEAVRRHFRLERMSLLAHSFGSVLVARYGERYPERLGRAVFVGAVGPQRAAAGRRAQAAQGTADTAQARRLREIFQRFRAGDAEDPIALCRAYETLGREMAAARGELASPQRGTTCAAPADAVRYHYRYTAWLAPASFGAWDFTASLHELEAPLLVIHGARDSAGTPGQASWVRAVPNARLLLVPDAGKSVHVDRPEVFFRAVREFFAGRWPVGATAEP